MRYRVLPVVVCLVVSCASPRPPPDLRDLPRDLGWRSHVILRGPGDEEFQKTTRFVSQGDKWRLDEMTPDRKGAITIYDGERLVTTSSGSKIVDPRDQLEKLYNSLPGYQYLGETTLESDAGGPEFHLDSRCWYFSMEQGGLSSELWIDMETHLPRRRIVTREDSTLSELFFDLPEDFELKPDLFDAAALERRIKKVSKEELPGTGPTAPEPASGK